MEERTTRKERPGDRRVHKKRVDLVATVRTPLWVLAEILEWLCFRRLQRRKRR